MLTEKKGRNLNWIVYAYEFPFETGKGVFATTARTTTTTRECEVSEAECFLQIVHTSQSAEDAFVFSGYAVLE